MSPKIDFSHKFDKQFKKAPLGIKEAFRERLEIFISNRYHPLLNNHQLTGKFKWHKSINVTGDWRVLFREYINSTGQEVIVFVLLGTHSQLYK